MRAKGDLPNLAREILHAWSFRLADPTFQSRKLEVDCGLVFKENVPAQWIEYIETLGD